MSFLRLASPLCNRCARVLTEHAPDVEFRQERGFTYAYFSSEVALAQARELVSNLKYGAPGSGPLPSPRLE